MPRKPAKTRNLIRALQQMGFVASGRRGTHAIFRHAGTGLVITLPTNRDEIPLVYLRSIERQIGNFDIVSDDELQKLLYSHGLS